MVSVRRVEVGVPGDKSIAHRLLILASLADGPCSIENLPASLDVASTLLNLHETITRE